MQPVWSMEPRCWTTCTKPSPTRVGTRRGDRAVGSDRGPRPAPAVSALGSAYRGPAGRFRPALAHGPALGPGPGGCFHQGEPAAVGHATAVCPRPTQVPPPPTPSRTRGRPPCLEPVAGPLQADRSGPTDRAAAGACPDPAPRSTKNGLVLPGKEGPTARR